MKAPQRPGPMSHARSSGVYLRSHLLLTVLLLGGCSRRARATPCDGLSKPRWSLPLQHCGNIWPTNLYESAHTVASTALWQQPTNLYERPYRCLYSSMATANQTVRAHIPRARQARAARVANSSQIEAPCSHERQPMPANKCASTQAHGSRTVSTHDHTHKSLRSMSESSSSSKARRLKLIFGLLSSASMPSNICFR